MHFYQIIKSGVVLISSYGPQRHLLPAIGQFYRNVESNLGNSQLR